MSRLVNSKASAIFACLTISVSAFAAAVWYQDKATMQAVVTDVMSIDASSDKVAIGIQGTCEEANVWRVILSEQHHRHQTEHFFLMYDQSPATCKSTIGSPAITQNVISGLGSSWSTGRNTLAQAIYRAEQLHSLTYKYWLFSDADAGSMQCVYCTHLVSIRQTACCVDQFVSFLVGPQQFAVVAFNAYWVDETLNSTFSRHDCPDAMFNAFHRKAIPLLLPYIDDMDAQSWWYSQAMLFHVSVGCLKGGTVTLGGFYADPDSPGNHANYPRGYERQVASALLTHHFADLIPWPIATSDEYLTQITCLVDRHDDVPLMHRLVPWQQRFTGAALSYAWHSTPEFASCFASLNTSFSAFIQSAGS